MLNIYEDLFLLWPEVGSYQRGIQLTGFMKEMEWYDLQKVVYYSENHC